MGGVKKSENFADVIYGSPLRSNQRGENAYKRVQPRTRKLQYSPRNAFQRRQKIEYAAKARRKNRAAEVNDNDGLYLPNWEIASEASCETASASVDVPG